MILRKLLSQSVCFCNYHKISHSFSTLGRTIKLFDSRLTSLKNTKTNYSQIYDVNTNVVKDVIIYKYDNPKFFKMLNIFALCQFGFWAYLSHFAFTTMIDAPVKETTEDLPTWRKVNLGENKYRNTITIMSFLVGYGILAGAWMYSLKSVRYLVLRKGGKAITFVTYGPFGKNRMTTIDLKYISAKDTRQTARSYLPIKVKNQMLHYLLDMKGEFKNAKLFDYTAGLKRNLM